MANKFLTPELWGNYFLKEFKKHMGTAIEIKDKRKVSLYKALSELSVGDFFLNNGDLYIVTEITSEHVNCFNLTDKSTYCFLYELNGIMHVRVDINIIENI